MTPTEAMDILLAHFPITRAGTDPDGGIEYDLGGDTPFILTEVNAQVIRLAHVVRSVGSLKEVSDHAQRLLEANCLGAETGKGQMAYAADLGAICYVEFIDTAPLNEDLLKYRVVDFMLYATFWSSQDAPPQVDPAQGAALLPEAPFLARV